MIAYKYLIVPNFAVEEIVVVYVVFDLSSYRVQRYLVDKYYLIDQNRFNYFFVGY